MIIKDARFYLNGRVAQKDIKIEKGRIAGIGKFSGKGINAAGLFALPGLIDPHVHLREPGLTYKEDFRTGTRAALHGGFTTVLDMPNTKPPTTTKKALLAKEKIASKKAACDYGLHFGATAGNFAEVKKANPPTLKLYMGQSTGSMQVSGGKAIEKHFATFPKNRPLILHAEDGAMLNALASTGDYTRPPIAELSAVGKAVSLSRREKRVAYFAHTTTADALTLAKSWEKSVVEVSPHHLFLSIEKDLKYLRERALVYPPLRSESERASLWAAMDYADTVGSDHAPHTLEDKEGGAAGFPGLETSLSLFLDAYNKSILPLPWIISRMSENPARVFGLKNKGKIAKGYDGDIALVDLRKQWVVRAEEFESKCGWTPYEGFRLKGKVEKVILRGNLVVDDSEVIGKAKGKRVF